MLVFTGIFGLIAGCRNMGTEVGNGAKEEPAGAQTDAGQPGSEKEEAASDAPTVELSEQYFDMLLAACASPFAIAPSQELRLQGEPVITITLNETERQVVYAEETYRLTPVVPGDSQDFRIRLSEPDTYEPTSYECRQLSGEEDGGAQQWDITYQGQTATVKWLTDVNSGELTSLSIRFAGESAVVELVGP
jgi:hypothetical protein